MVHLLDRTAAATLSLAWLLVQAPKLTTAKCPYAAGNHDSGTAEKAHAHLRSMYTAAELAIMSKQRTRDLLMKRSGDGGIPDGGFSAVKEDIKVMLTNSQDFWRK
jgi:hypothetical protein